MAKQVAEVYHCTMSEALRLMIPAQMRGQRVREKRIPVARLVMEGEELETDVYKRQAWGRLARYAQNLSMGDMISISGRMQSRIYEKTLPDGSVVEKTAYEVSIGSLEKNQEVTV